MVSRAVRCVNIEKHLTFFMFFLLILDLYNFQKVAKKTDLWYD